MRRIRLIVSYDGTNYCGWQIQENAVTVDAYRRIAKMAERRHRDNRSEPHGFRCACVWKYRCV